MVSPATSGQHFQVRKMAENATSDGFKSKFSVATFPLTQPIGEFR